MSDAEAFTLQKSFDVEKEFEVLSTLGQGSYGEVYRARHIRSGKVIALKKQLLGRDKDAEIIREIRIMETLSCPYIIGYYGSVLQKGYMWIVMELCKFGSVNDLMVLTRQTLNENQIATLAQAALNGLHYMASMEKIHRDVKPHNILVNANGEAKLCDFGISSELRRGQRRKTVIGTPYYLAPEVIQEVGYDYKCDVWALGISCIEMAEYNPPLHDAHPMRVLFMIPLNPSPTLTNPEHWSPEFNDFLRCALHKDPEQRWDARRLLSHPFITQKANIQSLAPYLARVDAILERFGSLDKALRAAHARGERALDESDDDASESVTSQLDEKALFSELPDASASSFGSTAPGHAFEDALSDEEMMFEESSLEFSDDADTALSFSLSDSDEDYDEPPREARQRKEVTEARPLAEIDENGRKRFSLYLDLPKVRQKKQERDERGERSPTARSPTGRGSPSSRRGGHRTPHTPLTPLTPQSPSLKHSPHTPTPPGAERRRGSVSSGKNSPKLRRTASQFRLASTIVESGNVKAALESKTIDLSKLIHDEPPFPSPHLTEPVSREAALQYALEKELEEKQHALSAAKGLDDYMATREPLRAVNVMAQWDGTGLLRNPWRNNPQFKVSVSAPAVVCFVLDSEYFAGALDGETLEGVAAQELGLSVIKLMDAATQILVKPMSAHTQHRWRRCDDPARPTRVSLQLYLEDPRANYVFVPWVNLLGDRTIGFRMSLIHPADVQVQLTALPRVHTVSAQGEWRESSAGGTVDGSEWRRNPQYVLEVRRAGTYHLFLAQYAAQEAALANIGFYVAKVERKQAHKKLLWMESHELLVNEQHWRRAPEVTTQKPLQLEPGVYIIIPCTFYPKTLAKFLLSCCVQVRGEGAAAGAGEACTLREIANTYHSAATLGSWTKDLSGGNAQNPDWISNPCYALNVTEDASTVHFFIDRKPWARKGEKRANVGLYIFRAEPHQLPALTRSRLVFKSAYFSDSKEVYHKVKKMKRGSYLVLIATFVPGQLGRFLLRAYSEKPFVLSEVSVAAGAASNQIELRDEWNEHTAGGAFNFHQWRKNPQFFLQSKKALDVAIVLKQDALPLDETVASDSPYTYAGFYVFLANSGAADGETPKLTASPDEVVHITPFRPLRRIVWETRLQPSVPLVLMPTTFHAGVRTKFSLTVSGVGVEPGVLDFHKIEHSYASYTFSSEWSIRNDLAGGCHNFSRPPNDVGLWLRNPQVLIVTSKKRTPLTIVLTQHATPPHPCGIYVLRKEKGVDLTKRSVHSVSSFNAEAEMTHTCTLPPGAYVLLFTTFKPESEGKIDIAVYSRKPIVWKPIK